MCDIKLTSKGVAPFPSFPLEPYVCSNLGIFYIYFSGSDQSNQDTGHYQRGTDQNIVEIKW